MDPKLGGQGGLLMGEGFHIDYANNSIMATYVDLRHPDQRTPIQTLIKGSEKRYSIEQSRILRVSKPGKFRESGEGLIRDAHEMAVTKIYGSREIVNDPDQLAEAKLRDSEINRTAELSGFVE